MMRRNQAAGWPRLKAQTRSRTVPRNAHVLRRSQLADHLSADPSVPAQSPHWQCAQTAEKSPCTDPKVPLHKHSLGQPWATACKDCNHSLQQPSFQELQVRGLRCRGCSANLATNSLSLKLQACCGQAPTSRVCLLAAAEKLGHERREHNRVLKPVASSWTHLTEPGSLLSWTPQITMSKLGVCRSNKSCHTDDAGKGPNARAA